MVVSIWAEKRKAEASGPTINPSMLKKDKTNEWHFRCSPIYLSHCTPALLTICSATTSVQHLGDKTSVYKSLFTSSKKQ